MVEHLRVASLKHDTPTAGTTAGQDDIVVEPIAKSGQDFGFGEALSKEKQQRLINRDGSFNVQRSRKRVRDYFSYSSILQASWPAFLATVILSFLSANLLFGLSYCALGSSALALEGAGPGVPHIWMALFFSVHTFTTIGYGNVVPIGMFANLLVVAESFVGLVGYSLVTGLLFARFTRPNTRIRFSLKGVMRGGDQPALLIRLTNTSRSEIIQVEATVVASFFDPDNPHERQFYPLTLERSAIAFLPLSWTVVHVLSRDSPYHGLSEQQVSDAKGELLLQLRGIDQASSQTVYARVSYTAEEIVWNARYADIYMHDHQSGLLTIDLARFDSVIPS